MEVAGKRRLSTGAVLWLITAALMLFAIVPTLRQYAVVGHELRPIIAPGSSTSPPRCKTAIRSRWSTPTR